jgi:hypothetical protein
VGYPNCAERLEVETIELVGEPAEAAPDYGFIDRGDLRTFLVACLQASVSIESMSRYLGLDQETVRAELKKGIEAWNCRKRRADEARARPQLKIAASSD